MSIDTDSVAVFYAKLYLATKDVSNTAASPYNGGVTMQQLLSLLLGRIFSVDC